jgi:Fic family protein
MIYPTPSPDLDDEVVLEEIHGLRRQLADYLRTPRRWEGGLRRSMLARAIRGSNSIEGYHVEIDDAAAALDDEEPLSADQTTFTEIRGYRQALGYVLAMSADLHFTLDASAVRSMHFMMLGHDLTKSPGRYRTGPIYVHDEATSTTVYEGPDAAAIPGLVDELMADLSADSDADPLIRAAMSHLNLVMIHPFRDGNGRMARALQTLVLSRGGIAEPAFSSIEEWLGHNTDDYYRALALTGQGAWRPDQDASLWVKFNLRAHHIQAQTLNRRLTEASEIWTALDGLSQTHGLPERVAAELYDATLGFRIRRATYVKRAGIEERTASRDLARLAELELLQAVGQTKGRHYVAGPTLRSVRADIIRSRPAISDPYPWMSAHLRTSTHSGDIAASTPIRNRAAEPAPDRNRPTTETGTRVT